MYILSNYAYDGKPNIEDGNYVQNINVLVSTSDGKMQQWYPMKAIIPMNKPMDNLLSVQQEIQAQAIQFVTETFNS